MSAGPSGNPEPSTPDPELPGRIERAWPVSGWGDLNVVIAVSGGGDSVALLRALVEIKHAYGGRGEVVVATYDHRVRESDSHADAQWVAELAERLNVPCVFGASQRNGPRSEAEMRDERRDFLLAVARERGARYVATGHTLDDQAETVLFRAVRGAGLRGVASIRRIAQLADGCTLVRPLLGETRNDLRRFLAALGQPFREDGSNDDPVYARNWLRAEVLPLIEQRFPTARSELGQLAEHAAEAEELIASFAGELLEAARLAGDAGVVLDANVLSKRPAPLVAEVLRLVWRDQAWPQQELTSSHWRRLAEMARSGAETGAIDLPAGVRAVLAGSRLHISRKRGSGDDVSC